MCVYGPINRSSEARTGRRNTDRRGHHAPGSTRMGGSEKTRLAARRGVEAFDEESQARPAAIFLERVIDPPHERHGVDSPTKPSRCLDEIGTVTVERVAEPRHRPTHAREQLGELVYDEPGTNRPSPHRSTCRATSEPSSTPAAPPKIPDGRYRPNIAALERVPRQLEPTEITARPGAPWIPTDIEQFCREVLDASVDVEHLHSSATGQHGCATAAAAASLCPRNGAPAEPTRSPSSMPRSTSGSTPSPTPPTTASRVRNDAETLAARDKQEALTSRFSTWVWETPNGEPSRLAATTSCSPRPSSRTTTATT